MAAQI